MFSQPFPRIKPAARSLAARLALFAAARLTLLLTIVLLLLLGACSGDPEGPVSALHHFRKGNEAYAIEDFQRAIRHFEAALKLDQQTPEIYYNLGLAHYRTENTKRAVWAFQGALRLNPAMANAHYNLALAYDRLYQPDAAHTHFNTYRSMVGGREKNRKDAAETDTAGREGTVARRPSPRGRPTPKTAPSAARRGQANRATTGSPLGRHTPAPVPPGQGTIQSGDPNKWWTQDKFNQKR